MKLDIKNLPEIRALGASACGVEQGNYTRAAKEAFEKLCVWAGRHGLNKGIAGCGSVSDDPCEKPPAECRFTALLWFEPGTTIPPLDGEVEWLTLAAGRYATTIHRGPYEKLGETWAAIMREGIPQSGLKPRHAPPYEVYLNSPDTTPPEQLLTEIRIPVEG